MKIEMLTAEKKKIVFFIFSMHCGGAQRVAVLLLEHWIKLGHDVTLVTISSASSYYELPDKLKVHSLNLDQISKNLFDGLRSNLYRILALRSVLKKEKPDVAVAFMVNANVFLGLATLFMPIRTVGSERIHPPYALLSRFWELLRKYTYRLLNTVIVQTNDSAEWVRKNTYATEVVVIPNPVTYPLPKSSTEIKQTESPLIANDKKILLAVGRLESQKGFDLLIDAYAKISDKHKDWNLCILGDGTMRDSLKKQILFYKLNEQIHLVGNVSDIESWYKLSSLYVMSSRYEGFPNALLEAMAYGLPCVSFDCPTGPVDIIRHNFDGVLVARENKEDLALELDKVMSDSSLRNRLSSNGINVRDRFDKDVILKRFNEVLDI